VESLPGLSCGEPPRGLSLSLLKAPDSVLERFLRFMLQSDTPNGMTDVVVAVRPRAIAPFDPPRVTLFPIPGYFSDIARTRTTSGRGHGER
jgi:hypothetical protein